MTEDEVHIWHRNLHLKEAEFDAQCRILSAEELQRAARYRFEIHRHRFVAARSFLRMVLAHYLGVGASAVHIETSATGKPFVAGAGFEFNLSHSEGLALCAVAERQVGVDLEAVRAIPGAIAIADRFFAPSEIASLRELPENEVTERFLHYWTRKEALLKAAGLGLTVPLNTFSVDPCLDGPVDFSAKNGHWQPWWLRTLAVPAGYIGALAIEGSRPEIITMQDGDRE